MAILPRCLRWISVSSGNPMARLAGARSPFSELQMRRFQSDDTDPRVYFLSSKFQTKPFTEMEDMEFLLKRRK